MPSWCIGLAFIMLLAHNLDVFTLYMTLATAVTLGAAGGAITALIHYWVLGKDIPVLRLSDWLVFTVLGNAIGWTAAELYYLLAHKPGSSDWLWMGFTTMGVVGLAVGVCQWWALALRVRYSLLWVPVCAGAYALGGLVYWVVYLLVGAPFTLPWASRSTDAQPEGIVYLSGHAAGWLLGGCVVALITGLVFRFLLSQTGNDTDRKSHSLEYRSR
jgi:hypothetical protein